jgi:hypothetical protein
VPVLGWFRAMATASSWVSREPAENALGKTDSGGGWLRVQLEQPGVLLLRRLGPGGPRRVAVAIFGHTGLGMLICRIAGVAFPYTYAPSCMSPTTAATVNSALPLVSGRARAPTLNGGGGDLPHEEPYAYRLVLGCSVGCGWLAMSFATGIIKIVGSLPISDLIPGTVAPRSLANLLSG